MSNVLQTVKYLHPHTDAVERFTGDFSASVAGIVYVTTGGITEIFIPWHRVVEISKYDPREEEMSLAQQLKNIT